MPAAPPGSPSGAQCRSAKGGPAKAAKIEVTSLKIPGGRIIALSSSALQALKRLGELCLAGLRLVALLALALDDFLRRALEKIGVAEFLIDTRDIGVAFGDFFREPRALGGKVDNAL